MLCAMTITYFQIAYVQQLLQQFKIAKAAAIWRELFNNQQQQQSAGCKHVEKHFHYYYENLLV